MSNDKTHLVCGEAWAVLKVHLPTLRHAISQLSDKWLRESATRDIERLQQLTPKLFWASMEGATP